MPSTEPDTGSDAYDVAIVGGGPTGCSAGVFTGRYGLRTVVFDRGCSSLQQCAHLENYLGFPGGIDVETFATLIHDHAAEAGCEVVTELVARVTYEAGSFRIETDAGSTVEADRVVAATKFDASYLEPMDPASLFTQADGDRQFCEDAVDADGRTAVEGLYVAGPLAGVPDQAVIAAGHGARVARALIADLRRAAGYWSEIAEPYDWVRREAELDGEWRCRDRWHEWFDGHDEPEGLSTDAVEAIREAYIDDALGMYVTTTDIDHKRRRGQHRIADHLDDRLQLEAISDERIREYLATRSAAKPGGADE